MGNGEWGMGNGEWGIGTGDWDRDRDRGRERIADSQDWGLGTGESGMGNGEWGVGNGEWRPETGSRELIVDSR